jgi:ribosome-associated translation inhibitor RaiA
MVEIRFVNFDRSEALETYVHKHLGSLLKRFEKREAGPHTFEVHFKLDAKAPLGQIKNNEVILIYRYPGLSKPVHIHKKGADLRKVFMQAVHTLKDSVQKSTEKKEGARRKLRSSRR